MRSSKGETINLKQEPVWSSAQTYKLENGTDIVSMPLKISLTSQTPLTGSMALLIYKTDKGFKSKIVYSKDSSYNTILSKSIIEKMYQKALEKENSLVQNLSSNGRDKTMSAPMVREKGEHCVEWYLLTTYYDEDGYFISDDVEYLYTICTFVGDGSGGNAANPNNCSDLASALTYESISENGSRSVTTEAPDRKKAIYQWKFIQNSLGLWNYVSTETGYYKKVGSDWRWDTLTHTKYTKNGTYIGVALRVDHISDVATIGLYNASITIYWEFTGSLVCNGSPINTHTTSSSVSPTFTIVQDVAEE
ncbi:hypothetical protein [Pedobacter boryungensis]|uniref:Uncharacterized protein n=1 Tax=Pedobacter boryungensis TaxID=869962 RepID=A0ABX2DBP2_9SPHI|nr:hypothetical protein [Pedobacter boryungensis]NQX31435.1 hypothetical protein [Pedobacter boryungensis]